MSTRSKIRFGYIALILLIAFVGRGYAHTASLLLALRVTFYTGVAGYFVYGYIARRKQTDKTENVDVAPLKAKPIQNESDPAAPAR